MIEPLACTIQYLLTQSAVTALVGTRIAPQHRYGAAWSKDQASLMLQWDGGEPDLYLPIHRLRIEVRAYAPSHLEAARVWLALKGVARDTVRVRVTVGAEAGLLYSLLPDGGPMALWDAELDLPCLYGFYLATVGENALT